MVRGDDDPRLDEEAELKGLATGTVPAFSAAQPSSELRLVNRLLLGPFLLITSGAVDLPFGRVARIWAGSFSLSRSIVWYGRRKALVRGGSSGGEMHSSRKLLCCRRVESCQVETESREEV